MDKTFNQRKWEVIALYMSALVIMIPLFSSMAFAESRIVTTTISGEDGVHEYRKDMDMSEVKVNITSDLIGAGLRANHVEIIQTGTPIRQKFNRCTRLPGQGNQPVSQYECMYRTPAFLVEEETISYCVNVREQGIFPRTCEQAQDGADTVKDLTLFVDVVGPQFTEIASNMAAIAGSGTIQIGFSGFDTLQGIRGERCIGVRDVQVHKNELLFKTILAETFAQQDGCDFAHVLEVAAEELDHGVNELCFFATDNFGNMEDNGDCLRITKSDLAPNVHEIRLLHQGTDEQIQFVQPAGVAATLSLLVATTYHVLDQVQVDLTQVGGGANTPLDCQEIFGEDSDEEGDIDIDEGIHLYTCEKDVDIRLGDNPQPTITINAADVAGNTISQPHTLVFTIDAKPPTTKGIESAYTFIDQSYLGAEKNELTVYIEELESGIKGWTPEEPTGVQFTIDEVPIVSSVSCQLISPGQYACQSEIEHIIENDVATVGVIGTDKVGTALVVEPVEFPVDNEKPEITAVFISPYTEPSARTEEGILVGQPVVVSAFILEGFALPEAPIVGFQFGAEQLQGCAIIDDPDPRGTLGVDRVWKCDWVIEQVFAEQTGQLAKANFEEFKDLANNPAVTGGNLKDIGGVEDTAEINKFFLERLDSVQQPTFEEAPEEVPIFGTSNTVPTNWRFVDGHDIITSIPKTLDAKAIEVSMYSVVYQFQLTTEDPVELAAINFLGCESPDFENYADSTRTRLVGKRATVGLGDIGGDFIGRLKVVFEKGPFDAAVRDFNAKCHLQLLSRGATSQTQHLVSTMPQQLSFNITSGVGNVLEINDETWDTIRELTESVENFEIIGTINNFLSYLTTICDVATALFGFVTLATGISATVGTVLESFQFTKAAGMAIAEFAGAVNIKVRGYQKTVGELGCNWVTCRAVGDEEGSVSNAWYNVVWEWVRTANEYLRENGYPGQVWNDDPRGSLILSMITICIPGIVQNLQKWREIQCQYIDCLYERGKQGYPKFYCDKTRSFATCKAVFGEIFALIPFASVARGIVKKISEAIKNPVVLAFFVVRLACSKLAHVSNIPFALCQALNLPGDVKAFYEQAEEIFSSEYWEQFSKYDVDSCSEVIPKIQKDPIFEKKVEEAEPAEETGVAPPITPNNEPQTTQQPPASSALPPGVGLPEGTARYTPPAGQEETPAGPPGTADQPQGPPGSADESPVPANEGAEDLPAREPETQEQPLEQEPEPQRAEGNVQLLIQPEGLPEFDPPAFAVPEGTIVSMQVFKVVPEGVADAEHTFTIDEYQIDVVLTTDPQVVEFIAQKSPEQDTFVYYSRIDPENIRGSFAVT